MLGMVMYVTNAQRLLQGFCYRMYIATHQGLVEAAGLRLRLPAVVRARVRRRRPLCEDQVLGPPHVQRFAQGTLRGAGDAAPVACDWCTAHLLLTTYRSSRHHDHNPPPLWLCHSPETLHLSLATGVLPTFCPPGMVTTTPNASASSESGGSGALGVAPFVAGHRGQVSANIGCGGPLECAGFYFPQG